MTKIVLKSPPPFLIIEIRGQVSIEISIPISIILIEIGGGGSPLGVILIEIGGGGSPLG